ncbi:MAG TPA: Spy/CpxP family protein refolding chaperone [Ignavibacteriaceae bacterium]|nr:Spy/CpxP family protein refolding chaperone [Ignavibacteriaceae bacterium]
MKTKILLSALLVFSFVILTGANAFAQGRGQNQNDRVEAIKKTLSLTDKQTEKVKAIYTKSREDMQKTREENMGDRDAMMKALKENTERTNKEIEKILTPEQKKKFTVLKEQWKKEREERMKNFGQ